MHSFSFQFFSFAQAEELAMNLSQCLHVIQQIKYVWQVKWYGVLDWSRTHKHCPICITAWQNISYGWSMWLYRVTSCDLGSAPVPYPQAVFFMWFLNNAQVQSLPSTQGKPEESWSAWVVSVHCTVCMACTKLESTKVHGLPEPAIKAIQTCVNKQN